MLALDSSPLFPARALLFRRGRVWASEQLDHYVVMCATLKTMRYGHTCVLSHPAFYPEIILQSRARPKSRPDNSECQAEFLSSPEIVSQAVFCFDL